MASRDGRVKFTVYVSYSLHVVVAGRYFAVDVFSVSMNLPVDKYNVPGCVRKSDYLSSSE